VPTAVVVEQLVSRALEEAVSRIVRKVSEGKKLSDREVAVLVMSLIVRRFDDLKEYVDERFNDMRGYVDKGFEDFKTYVDGRFNSVESRIEGLENRLNMVHSEVSSIKTDIIKIMRELLERAYGK
jgi:phage-related protein